MSTNEVAIEVKNVSKNFGSLVAVDDISFTVAKGRTTAIIGPNGAGKSTLFGVIAGEHAPSAGTVRLGDKDVSGWPASKLARTGMSRTFQVARLFPRLSVVENLMVARVAAVGAPFGFWRGFGSKQGDRDRVEEVLERMQLGPLASRLGGLLAQGDRKRLELAMAIVQDPQILLLDEPTAGMSLEDVGETLTLLQEVMVQQSGLTVVLTAHDMDVVFSLSDRVILMGRGRLMVEGSPTDVENHPVTRELYLGKSS